MDNVGDFFGVETPFTLDGALAFGGCGTFFGGVFGGDGDTLEVAFGGDKPGKEKEGVENDGAFGGSAFTLGGALTFGGAFTFGGTTTVGAITFGGATTVGAITFGAGGAGGGEGGADTGSGVLTRPAALSDDKVSVSFVVLTAGRVTPSVTGFPTT